MKIKIHCPKCGRVMGDTDRAIDGLKLNCRGCKSTVDIKVKVAPTEYDYLKINNKENEKK